MAFKKGYKQSDETKKKISERMMGENNPMKKIRTHNGTFKINHKETKEIKEKRKISIKKAHKEGKYSHLKGKSPWNKGIKMWENKEHPRGMLGKESSRKGKKLSEETIIKIKEARSKQIVPIKDTSIELKIQDFLTNLKIEFITHKYMNIKHSYQCDILIPSINLVIECDGDFFHMNPNKFSSKDKIFEKGMTAKERWKLDDSRTKELIEKGYNVIRIWQNEIRKMSIEDFKIKLGVVKNGF